MIEHLRRFVSAAGVMTALLAANANAALVRADFTAVIDEASYGVTNWTSLIGQGAYGYFQWDTETPSLEYYGAPNRYRFAYSVVIPGVSSLPITTGFWEGGARLDESRWLVGGSLGDFNSVISSLSIIPGGLADGTFTPDIAGSLFTFRVDGTSDDSRYHCPISAPSPFPDGQSVWVQCRGTGHLTSLDLHFVPESSTLALAVAGLGVLVAVRKRRSNGSAALTCARTA